MSLLGTTVHITNDAVFTIPLLQMFMFCIDGMGRFLDGFIALVFMP